MPGSSAVDALWPHLKSSDRWIRQAARVAIERQPVEEWQKQALAELDPTAAGTALVALARCGAPEIRGSVFARLIAILKMPLDDEQRLIVARAAQLAMIRLGPPEPNQALDLVAALSSSRKITSAAEREMLSELLIALKAPDRISAILGMLDSAPTQEEQLWHIFALRNVDRGWTLSQREQYFQWLKRSEDFSGAHYLHRFLTFIRTDALGTLSAGDRKDLSPLIDRLGKSTGVALPAIVARPEIRKWTLDELTPALDSVGPGRDLARGKRLFAEALCARCHRLRGEGLPIGPDLDGVAARFGRARISSKRSSRRRRSWMKSTET